MSIYIISKLCHNFKEIELMQSKFFFAFCSRPLCCIFAWGIADVAIFRLTPVIELFYNKRTPPVGDVLQTVGKPLQTKLVL